MKADSASSLDAAIERKGGARAVVQSLAQAADDGAPNWVHAMQAWEQPTLQRLGCKRTEVRHAVKDLIRAGKVGALVAAGGTGKTTLLLALGICHATGRQFFGLDVVVGTFVLISNDDPQDDLEMARDEVMRAMDLDDNEVAQVAARLRLHSVQGEAGTKAFTCQARGDIESTGLDHLILQAVSGIPDLVGVALDTLRQFSGGSSNDEQVIKLTIAGATEVALRTGAYVVLPHHTGKQNYRDGVSDMYCGSGSAAIADNCRFVLLLQTTTWGDIESKVRRTGQERGDPLVLSSTRGSLLMRPMAPIFLCREGFCIDRVAGASLTRDEQEDAKDRAILRAVRGGAQTKNAIGKVVRGNRKACLDRVDDLEERGHIAIGSAVGSGKYVVTASGARLLELSE